MNPTLERLALRARSHLMAHRRHRPDPTQRLTNWARSGPPWRWLPAGPALLLVVTATVAWWVASQAAGVAAILAGWSPPLTLAALATTPPSPHPEPLPVAPAPARADDQDDPAAWNFNHDPWVRLQQEQLALQREQLAELRLQRQTRAAELAAEHRPQRSTGPGPAPAYWAPPVAGRRRRRSVRVAHALVIVAVVGGLAWGIGAFSLGVASSAGWVRQPPTFTQLERTTP